MTSSNYGKVGGLVMPVGASDVVQTLAPLDPGRDRLLGLFRQAIISELGAAWNTVATGTRLTGQSVVQAAWPLAPTPELIRTLNADWPLLAVYRSGEATIEQYTVVLERLKQPWQVDYVLGPLTPEDQRRLTDVLTAVVKVVMTAVEKRGHPDYDSGALQFFPTTGAFAECVVRSYALGPAQFAGSDDAAIYHACSIKLETSEMEDYRAEYLAAPLQGASFSFAVGNEVELLPDAIIADTDAIVP